MVREAARMVTGATRRSGHFRFVVLPSSAQRVRRGYEGHPSETADLHRDSGWWKEQSGGRDRMDLRLSRSASTSDHTQRLRDV